jgi:hypothetical protein
MLGSNTFAALLPKTDDVTLQGLASNIGLRLLFKNMLMLTVGGVYKIVFMSFEKKVVESPDLVFK